MIGTAHKLSTKLDNTEIVESTRQNPPVEADQTVADLHRGGFGFPDVVVELEDPDSDR